MVPGKYCIAKTENTNGMSLLQGDEEKILFVMRRIRDVVAMVDAPYMQTYLVLVAVPACGFEAASYTQQCSNIEINASSFCLVPSSPTTFI